MESRDLPWRRGIRTCGDSGHADPNSPHIEAINKNLEDRTIIHKVVPLLDSGMDNTGASDLSKYVVGDHPLANLSKAHCLNGRGFRQIFVTGISNDETTGSGGRIVRRSRRRVDAG